MGQQRLGGPFPPGLQQQQQRGSPPMSTNNNGQLQRPQMMQQQQQRQMGPAGLSLFFLSQLHDLIVLVALFCGNKQKTILKNSVIIIIFCFPLVLEWEIVASELTASVKKTFHCS